MWTFCPKPLETIYYWEKTKQGQISDLKFHKTEVCKKTQHENLLKISSATSQVAPDLSKSLAILSGTTVRRSAVDQEDLKPCWKWEKRQHFSRWSTSLLFRFTQLFKDFTDHRKKINRVVTFSCVPFPKILKYRGHQWHLPRIFKRRLFETHTKKFR